MSLAAAVNNKDASAHARYEKLERMTSALFAGLGLKIPVPGLAPGTHVFVSHKFRQRRG